MDNERLTREEREDGATEESGKQNLDGSKSAVRMIVEEDGDEKRGTHRVHQREQSRFNQLKRLQALPNPVRFIVGCDV